MRHPGPSARLDRLAGVLRRRWRRMAVVLLPLFIGLLHATGAWPVPVLERLDQWIYDARLRATMPRTLDERIVIVDIDEESLERVGHWPWGRDKMARFAQELLERQQAAVVGFDVVFAEPDGSSGLVHLKRLAQGPLRGQEGFVAQFEQLAPSLDFDRLFARTLEEKNAVLGYYFTSDRDGRARGVLPQPVLDAAHLQGRVLPATSWNGHGSNIEVLARAAPVAGFFNAMNDEDGVVRALPLLAEYQGQYFESLALAVFRRLLGLPEVRPAFAPGGEGGKTQPLMGIELHQDGRSQFLPVDDRLATLVPYRGPGGPRGGSFRYVSAADILDGRLPEGSLQGLIVLVGSTAPGLQDLRATPVGGAYPGVETHANVIAGFLDGTSTVRPDYAIGFEALQISFVGLLLALVLPLLGAGAAIILSTALLGGLSALNLWLYQAHGLAMPLAAVLTLVLVAFAVNMSYGYFVESRAKRDLAHLFGTYVPPELVEKMVLEPERYSMQAASRELTVMFCDMRGFTAMSERMEPVQLQALLNDIFTRLTRVIRGRLGTIDKYMGDCVMAFWGAPVSTAEHATLAVEAALGMVRTVQELNMDHRAQGLPPIGVGIGLNTGAMCVGDMGSDIRRSYTVIGDAVNLGSRLEGLCKVYGVEIVASETTQRQATGFVWQELDRVCVKGKEQAVAIFRPLGVAGSLSEMQQAALDLWHLWLAAFRAQDWQRCDGLWASLAAQPPGGNLLEMYGARLKAQRVLPYDPEWDGATHFDTK